MSVFMPLWTSSFIRFNEDICELQNVFMVGNDFLSAKCIFKLRYGEVGEARCASGTSTDGAPELRSDAVGVVLRQSHRTASLFSTGTGVRVCLCISEDPVPLCTMLGGLGGGTR